MTLICKKCNNEIKEGKYSILEDGGAFHQQCFTCSSCSKTLNENALVGEDKGFYHQDCFDNKFAKTCNTCQSKIKHNETSLLVGKDKYVHSKCFKCFHCKKEISGNFMEKAGKVFDAECFATLFSLKCDKCAKPFPLGTTYSEVAGKKYHKECFLCKTCSTPLTGKQFSIASNDGTFVCNNCVHKDVEARSKKAQERLEKQHSNIVTAPKPQLEKKQGPALSIASKVVLKHEQPKLDEPKQVAVKQSEPLVEPTEVKTSEEPVPISAPKVPETSKAVEEVHSAEIKDAEPSISPDTEVKESDMKQDVEPIVAEQQKIEDVSGLETLVMPSSSSLLAQQIKAVISQAANNNSEPLVQEEPRQKSISQPGNVQSDDGLSNQQVTNDAVAKHEEEIHEASPGNRLGNVSSGVQMSMDPLSAPDSTLIDVSQLRSALVEDQLKEVAQVLVDSAVKAPESTLIDISQTGEVSVDAQLKEVAQALSGVQRSGTNPDVAKSNTSLHNAENQSQPNTVLRKFEEREASMNNLQKQGSGSNKGSTSSLNVISGQPRPIVATANYHAHSPKQPRAPIIPQSRGVDGRPVNLAACTRCRRPCYPNEAFLTLKDNITHFHRECFFCEICANPLNRKYAMKNGKFYHAECYQAAKVNAPKCLKCYQQINPAEISVALGNDARFHRACFNCDACARPLSERFYQSRGQFLHEDCIRCDVCQCKLLGMSFSQMEDTGFICDPCYQQAVNSQNQPVGSTLIEEVVNIVDRPLPAQVQYYRDNYEEGFAQKNQQPEGNYYAASGYGAPSVQITPRSMQTPQQQDARFFNNQTSIETGDLVNGQ